MPLYVMTYRVPCMSMYVPVCHDIQSSMYVPVCHGIQSSLYVMLLQLTMDPWICTWRVIHREITRIDPSGTESKC